MMGGVPTIFFVVILEHGEVGDPEQAEVPRRVSGPLECAMAVSIFAREFQAELSGGGKDAVIRPRSRFLQLRRSGHQDQQVVSLSPAHLPPLANLPGTTLLQ